MRWDKFHVNLASPGENSIKSQLSYQLYVLWEVQKDPLCYFSWLR